MRTNYPLLSEELNDIFQDAYYKAVYLIGYDPENGFAKKQGLYDMLDTKISNNLVILYNMFSRDDTRPLYRNMASAAAIIGLRRL